MYVDLGLDLSQSLRSYRKKELERSTRLVWSIRHLHSSASSRVISQKVDEREMCRSFKQTKASTFTTFASLTDILGS
jgi:hypothetical protein